MDFKQTDAGDLEFTNNELTFVTGSEDALQRIMQRLRTIRGEWFLDRRLGTPYFEDIFKKRFVPSVVDAVIQNEILNTPGVIELQQFSLELNDARNLEVSFHARVTDNEIVVVEGEEIP